MLQQRRFDAPERAPIMLPAWIPISGAHAVPTQ